MESLRAGTAITVAGVGLIPVEWLEVTSQQDGGHIWLQANKEVVAVVLCDANGMRMVDMNGDPLSLEEWRPKVEGLEEGIEACDSCKAG